MTCERKKVMTSVLTIPELRPESRTLMWMFLRRSQLVSELFIHRRHSEPAGTLKASHIILWIKAANTNQTMIDVKLHYMLETENSKYISNKSFSRCFL